MSLMKRAPSALRVVALCGNNHRPSKSRALVERTALEFAELGFGPTQLYDMLDLGPSFGTSFARGDLAPQCRAILDAVESADALIVGTPVYKGSYTGIFKHFVDFLHPDSLLRKPVCITAAGGGYRHALVVEHQLRPLFGFFNALSLPTAIYAGEQDFTDGEVTGEEVLFRIRNAAREMSYLIQREQYDIAI